jgi:hypothetical protein
MLSAKYPENRNSESIVDIAAISNLFSDKMTIALFKMIAITNHNNTQYFLTKLKITEKQYYSRISGLIKVGLIKRRKGTHFLTIFGEVVYDTQTIIESALNNLWKLRIVDSVKDEIYDKNAFSKQEYTRLVDSLIESHRLREIILARSSARTEDKGKLFLCESCFWSTTSEETVVKCPYCKNGTVKLTS